MFKGSLVNQGLLPIFMTALVKKPSLEGIRPIFLIFE